MGGLGMYLHAFLIPAIDEGKWSVTYPGLLGIAASARQWIGGSANHRADLEAVETENIPSPSRTKTVVVQPKSSYVLTGLPQLRVEHILCRKLIFPRRQFYVHC
jgi:hypothetical protein